MPANFGTLPTHNGASACTLPDPADALPVHLGTCAGPRCRQTVYAGDEDALRDALTGELYCCVECYAAAAIRRGEVRRVVEEAQR